jgi:hypothetical protein
MGALPTKGLKLSVMLASGEDSITRAGSLELEEVEEGLEPPLAAVEELLEEQAARPAARSATAPAATALLLEILLTFNLDLSSRVLRFREGLVFLWLDGAVRH